MSHRSVKKQMAELAKQQAETAAIDRRRFLALGGGALALIAGYSLFNQFGKDPISSERNAPGYVDAFNDSSKQQSWLDSLSSRPYAAKHIATQEVLRNLEYTKSYSPPEGAFAVTFPIGKNIGKGENSDIYIFSECFNPLYQGVKSQMKYIIENVVENHELLHADHYFNGIPGYPIELFMKNEEVDSNLFNIVSEVFAHKSEFQNLTKHTDKGKLVQKYHGEIQNLLIPYLALLPMYTKNQTLLEKVKQELWF